MFINQISVFVENKPGRLADITELLAAHNIDIRALSIADTTDYGILRLIVDDPDKAVNVLRDAGSSVSMKPVLGICVGDTPGQFARAIRILADTGIDVEYAYAFITPDKGSAYVIVRVADNEKAAEALSGQGIKIIDQKDIFA